MTEAEWLASTDPWEMLEFLRDKASDRKLRLFAAASVRLNSRLLTDERSKNAIETAERVADRNCAVDALPPAYTAAWAVLPQLPDCPFAIVAAARAAGRTVQPDAYMASCLTTNEVVGLYAEIAEQAAGSDDAAYELHWEGKAEGELQCAQLVREIFGNPFVSPVIDPGRLSWNHGTARKLAEVCYEERHLPEGTLDNCRLAVLADALEEAGCTEGDLLGHLRGPGPHVRGCWALDVLLEKE
jgi:hypothetical protein